MTPGEYRDLGGITVDGLTACDDHIPLKGSERACEGIRGSESVRSCKLSVGQKDCPVHTHCEGFPEYLVGLGRSHGYYCNVGTVLILETESHLQSALVIGVHNTGHTVPDQCTGHGR